MPEIRCPNCGNPNVRGYELPSGEFVPTHCPCGATWKDDAPGPNWTRDRLRGAQGDD